MERRADNDVIVVGAGAAGLMAAVRCAERGLRIVALEQMAAPGLKLLASGGGRCNLANDRPIGEIVEAFGRHGRFALPALKALDPPGLRRFFDGLGVPTVVEPGGCVFSGSGKAADVLKALTGRLLAAGGRLVMGQKVVRLVVREGRVAGVETAGTVYPARSVILACGGRSYPRLGGTGGGYGLAAAAGHTLQPMAPALVPLVTMESWPCALAGLSVPDAQVRVRSKSRAFPAERGPLLFTHRGVSGPVVLNASGLAAELLSKSDAVGLEIQWVASEDRHAWRVRMHDWRRSSGARTPARRLQEFMPRALAEQLCALAGVPPGAAVSHLTREGAGELVRALTGLTLTVRGTEGFGHAMVTRGGVSLKEVAPATLESRRVAGLYFAGELLDLDGPCGGYNLQWAFSSGWLAADALCSR